MQHRIWQEQCAATRQIKLRYGTTAAFDYLVGEKLLKHVSAAAKHREFSEQLPAFVAEIRRIFDPDIFARELPKLEAKLVECVRRDAELDDYLPNLAQVELQALKMVSDLLTVQQLGTA